MMTFRRTTVGSALLALTALTVAACGRFVTPVPTNNSSDLSGKMVITFRTNGTMNFNTTQYEIVINTCATNNGTPNEPYPNVFDTTFLNYSYIFSTQLGSLGTIPNLYQVAIRQGSTTGLEPILIPPNGSLESFAYPYTNEPNEFQLIFTRAQLANPLGVSMPCPNQVEPTVAPSGSVTASPSPSAGVSPTATASSTASAAASPTASALASPSSSPTLPSVFPTNQPQQYWYINFFTVQNNQVQDSLGQGGPTDTTYNLGIDTTSTNQNAVFKATGSIEPSDPAAQLSGGEVDNYL